MELSYPPQPWVLHGHADVSLWLVPTADAPETVGKPIRIFGRVIVLGAFLRYNEPSPLVYNELLATQVVRDGWRPRVTITHIWVDSAASRDGGRTLWSIPKHLARFQREGTDTSSGRYEANSIARLNVTRSRSWPWGLPLRFALIQRDLVHRGRTVTTPVRGRARPGRVRARWKIAAAGPLAFLSHRKPLASVGITAFTLTFGTRDTK